MPVAHRLRDTSHRLAMVAKQPERMLHAASQRELEHRLTENHPEAAFQGGLVQADPPRNRARRGHGGHLLDEQIARGLQAAQLALDCTDRSGDW